VNVELELCLAVITMNLAQTVSRSSDQYINDDYMCVTAAVTSNVSGGLSVALASISDGGSGKTRSSDGSQ
jgi:hypothetical protein